MITNNITLRIDASQVAQAMRDAFQEIGHGSGVALIATERFRQVSVEGFDLRHDDQYQNGELLAAAICYIQSASDPMAQVATPDAWPWAPEWWKPTGGQRDLERAGALIAAEIDRRRRAKARAATGGEG